MMTIVSIRSIRSVSFRRRARAWLSFSKLAYWFSHQISAADETVAYGGMAERKRQKDKARQDRALEKEIEALRKKHEQ
jgi:hypothetical protein